MLILCGLEEHGTELKNNEAFLRRIAFYSIKNPNLVIRIHSGETTQDKSGIFDALNYIKEEIDAFKGEYPAIRIGHAVNGITKESCKLIKELGAAIELNISSNKHLNNFSEESLKKATDLLKKYNIPIYLGTDGYGMYETTPEKEFKQAKSLGIDILNVMTNEINYIKNLKDKNMEEIKINNKINTDNNNKYDRRIAKERLNILFSKNEITSVQPNNDIFKKIPIIIAGGSFKTRNEGNFEEYKEIEKTFQVLTNIINPKKCFFITGGTHCGPEMFFHQAIARTNSNLEEKKKINCLGLIPSYLGRFDQEDAIKDFDIIEKDGISHAFVLNNVFNGWGDYPKELISKAKDKENNENGLCIFIGGGGVVKDEIAYAQQENLNSFCYDGFGSNSASKEAINKYRENTNTHGWKFTEDLITDLYTTYNTQIFNESFIKTIKDFGLKEAIIKAKENAINKIAKNSKHTEFSIELTYNTLISERKYKKEQLDKIIKLLDSKIGKKDILDILGIDETNESDISFFIDLYLDSKKAPQINVKDIQNLAIPSNQKEINSLINKSSYINGKESQK